MRRYVALVFLILMLSCRAASYLPPHTVLATLTPTQASFLPSPALETATPTSTLPTLPEAAFTVHYHPDGDLYVGDQVSFEVIAPAGANMEGRQAVVQVEGLNGARFGPAEFGRYGIAGRVQATLTWAWNTSGLAPGSYNLDYSIEPGDLQWTETLTLLPQSDLPEVERQAHWTSAQSTCCVLYYITGTEAERDLPKLLEMADEQAAYVAGHFQSSFSTSVPLVGLPRVLGHGGFTEQEISFSYLDRRYTGGDTAFLVRHEMVHFLDNRLGGDLRPTILLEGLAVYMSGGHYKPEPILPRAAALLELGWYLPLQSLAKNFYPSQHEIGYMEAGALVEYMVERWGWDAFNHFYRDIHPDPLGDQVSSMDAALTKHFGISFSQLEADFLVTLRSQSVTDEVKEDVRLTVAFYDTARRYQQALDPSAYYMTAWLPDGKKMREQGIVADYLRHPSAPENVVLESLLVSADDHLRAGDYKVTEQLLNAVNSALEALGK